MALRSVDLPLEIAPEEGSLVVPWYLMPDGQPQGIFVEAGAPYILDLEQQFVQVRNDGHVRTVTPDLEVSISEKHREWMVEFRVYCEYGVGDPSVLITDDRINFDRQRFNVKQTSLFRAAMQVLSDPAFNPSGALPNEADYEGYIVDFKKGTVDWVREDDDDEEWHIDTPLPTTPYEMYVKNLRPLPGRQYGDNIEIPPDIYQVKRSSWNAKTREAEQWWFIGQGERWMEIDKAFVDHDVLIRELDLGHVIVGDVIPHEDIKHPLLDELS